MRKEITSVSIDTNLKMKAKMKGLNLSYILEKALKDELSKNMDINEKLQYLLGEKEKIEKEIKNIKTAYKDELSKKESEEKRKKKRAIKIAYLNHKIEWLKEIKKRNEIISIIDEIKEFQKNNPIFTDYINDFLFFLTFLDMDKIDEMIDATKKEIEKIKNENDVMVYENENNNN